MSGADGNVIRVGVIGAGFAAAAHVEALRRAPGVAVAGITASTPERARDAGTRFGIGTAFDSYDDLIAAPEIDAVHDCAPNYLHAEVNAAALDAGKHLLSEKPLGMSSTETRALAARAAAADVATGVCYNYRHYPLVRQAKDILASGEHGAPHLVHGSYLQDWLLYERDWNWRLEVDQAGRSRAVADIGSHWLDLVQYVTGTSVVRVCARLSVLHGERYRPRGDVQTFASRDDAGAERVSIATEDAATILLEFDNGATGSLCVSQVSPGRKNRLLMMVDTDRLGLTWDQEDPNRLWLGRRDAPNEVLMRDPALLTPSAAALAHYPGGHEEGWADGLKNLVRDFYAGVHARRGGSAHEVSVASFSDAHGVTRIVDAILQSNGSRTWVDVDREEIE